jgi:ADP-heptose:LPS heptosyltransferase/glycosyltransferase involved in cell wall biosynthesis
MESNVTTIKKKVLLVGEHPYGVTGNSHMMKAILGQIDRDLFDIACFSESVLPFNTSPFQYENFNIITPDDPNDQFGCGKLLGIIDRFSFDVIITVGTDLWHYSRIFDHIVASKRARSFQWAAIFPYDVPFLRKDWLVWIQELDYAGVYSKFGYDLLKPFVENLHYYRPPMLNWDIYRPFTPEERKAAKEKHFTGHDGGRFIFGFIGNNQVRKDPQRVIRTFFELKKTHPNICLYLHTNLHVGVYNLAQYIEDCGGIQGDILVKNQSITYSDEQMVEVYNAIDCLVNASLQEGLSWTILQAMLCKTPIVAAYNTAQMELLDDHCGLSVDCDELAYIPLITANGPSYVETRACSESDLFAAMDTAADGNYGEDILGNAYVKSMDWVQNTSNVNNLLNVLTDSNRVVQTVALQKILFMQHSSAGDVFMTTRCFKGLKERHPGLPFVFMTQPQYQDILEGNPYVDEIIDWNELESKKYDYVYNPHGTHIMPGHWGRNCNSILSDFYWKLLHVEPDHFFIERVPPNLDTKDWEFEIKINSSELLVDNKPILIVHTTGGDAHFRTYKYMKDICDFQRYRGKYITVQVGGKGDYPAGADIDLRGKLSFRETAWVVSKAELAVTVDSFISHLCGALGVSQVCLFGSGNYMVVQPNQVNGKLICMSPDYVRHCKGLGPCSGVLRDCPVPCTSRHDPKEVINNLLELEKGL